VNISIEVTGAKAARDQFALIGERARNLHPAYLRGGVVAMTAAQGRIRTKGDGQWAPQAFDVGKGSLMYRTGALMRSFAIEDMSGAPGEGAVVENLPDGIKVGSNLKTPDGKYTIARLMQDGTGIYGPKGQPIKPQPPNKALMVVLPDGSAFFRRSVKGSPKRRILFIDDKTAKKIAGVFATYIRTGEA
jgi:hypothetical protein